MPTIEEAVAGTLAPPAEMDPVAAAVAQTLRDDRVRTQQNLIGATRSNPDEAAKAVRLGAERGLPSDLVLRNLHEIQSRSVVDAASATLETSPTLKRLVTERPDLPKQAIDEIDKLAELERKVREHGALREYKGPEPSAGSIATGLAKTIPQTLTAVRDSIRLQMGDLLDSLGLLPEDEVTKRERMRRAEQSLGRTTYDDPNFESATAGAIYGGLKSTVQQGTGLAASILTGNPAPALATIGLQTEAQAYAKYRARGAGGGMSLLGGGLESTIEVGTELLPMKFLVNKLGKAGFGEFVSGLLGREMLMEQVATFTQDAVDTAIANPDKTWEQFLAERPAAAYQTAVAVITQSLVMEGANVALERYARATNQVNDAGRDADVMRALAALSAQVQLRERNPDEFRAMLQSMAEDAEGAPTQVRFDARTLVGEDGAGGLLNQEEMAQFPGLAEQMAEAVATGGEIVMPVSALLTVAPGTPLEQKLLENARIGDNELSQLEAKEAAAQAETYLQQEAERVIAESQGALATQASADAVRQHVQAQLDAAARFTPDVNEAYATLVQSFYTVLANRMGMTPEQAYTAYPLRVQGENPAAPGEVLNAGERAEAATAAATGERSPLTGKPLIDVLDAAGNKIETTHIAGTVEEALQNYRERPARQAAARAAAPAPSYYIPAPQPVEKGSNWRHVKGQEFTSLDADDGYLYHITSAPAAKGVRKEGLVPNAGRMFGGFYENYSAGKAFVTERSGVSYWIEKVEAQLQHAVDDPPAVVVLRIPKAKVKAKIEPDALGSADAGSPAFFSRETLEQPAYHGTPYRGIGQFSTEHIGKGEGAQVYGWGLYFASNAEIAEFYRKKLSGNGYTLNGTFFSLMPGITESPERAIIEKFVVLTDPRGDGMTPEQAVERIRRDAAQTLAKSQQNLAEVRTNVGKTVDAGEGWGELRQFTYTEDMISEQERSVAYAEKFVEMAQALTPDSVQKNLGQLYEVDVPNDDELLAYDAPLKDQPPKVKAALEGLGIPLMIWTIKSTTSNSTLGAYPTRDLAADAMKRSNFSGKLVQQDSQSVGSEAYKQLSRKLGSDEAASKALLAAGVKGLKYLDANSRGPTASKNYNFVVFSGDDVAIRNQYYQGPRGTFNPKTLTVSLLQAANLSTFLHETGHFFLEVLADVGSQPNAPTGVADDMGKLLSWFGVKDLAAWNSMTLDQKRKHHERFAESFEQYLLEGKAPSPELQPLFQRFRAWLVNVYRSLSEFMRGRNLELSDEVRGVFDRMLATDQQIKQAEDLRAYSLLFKSAEQAGMTPEAWAEYQREGAQATHDAIDKLQARSVKDMRWVSGARSRALKNLQRETEGKRRAVEAEVAAEVAQQPTYQAMRWLRKGEMTTAEGEEIKAEKGFHLSTAALAEMYPDTALDNPELARLKGLTAANGLHPDVVAAMFGFDSGDTLVRTLADAQPQAAVVEGMTDQRMLERFGDLATPQGLARAADEAVHNEARGRFIATGLRALQEANGKTEKTAAGGSVNVMVRAAKQFAEQLVARRKVRELKPGQHTQAEQRAGRAAQQAMAKNDTQAAIVAQRDQLLNHYAARATNTAIDETERALAYLKKFDKESIRKKLPIEYVDQIDKLLERVDLRQQTNAAIDKRSKLAAWIKAQQDMGIEVELPDYLLEDAKLTSYKDMSVEAFRGLVATVKQVEHLGRLKNKLLTAKDAREFAAIRDSMVQSVLDNAGSREADTRTPTTVLGKKLAAVKAFGAAHIKAAIYARIFDGGKDGGPVWEYLVRPANDAANRETKMNAEATAELSAILDPWRKAGNPNKRTPAPSIGRSLTRQERLVIALNIGNEGNLQRLLGGEGWTPAQLKPVLDELTKEDWRTVQAVWDHFEKRRALIDEVERNVYGKPLKKVDPGSMFTEAYKVKGGYYPIVYDPAASQRAEEHADAESAKRQLAGAYSAAHVRRGFTKARAEEVVGRPLMYDLSGVYRGVRDQLHYIAWTEWVIDANRILRDKAFDAAIREKYGPDAVRQLKSWRDAIAEGDGAAQEAMDTALGWMRRSVSVAGLGFNVMSAMIQPLGFTQSITRVGAGWVGKGVLHYLGNPVAVTRDVNSKSDFMANRSRTRFREINELRNRVEQQTAAKRFMNENAFALMMRCQQLVDVPTWWGAYEKAIAGGNTEDRARALADQAVIDAQGGGQTKDLSAIERGGPAQKLFTVFYSFMNTALNLGVASKMSPTGKAKFAADMLMLYVAPAVLGVLLKNALTPGDSGDEDKKLLQKLLAEQVGYLFGLMILGREVGEAAKTVLGLSDHPRDYAGPAGIRALADSYQFAKQAGQGEFDTSFRKATINLAGDLMGLPSAQLNRTITGAQALKEGKTKNPAALLFGYQEPR